MGTINIKGTINDVTQAFPAGQGWPNAGKYYAVGEPAAWGDAPCVGAMNGDRREIHFGGVAGTGEKDYGDTKAPIYVNIIIFDTLTNIRSTVQTYLNLIRTNTRYTITINGVQFLGCKLDIPSCGKAQRINFSHGIVGEVLPLVFKQMSTTN